MKEVISFVVGTIVGWAMPPLLVHAIYLTVIAGILGFKWTFCS